MLKISKRNLKKLIENFLYEQEIESDNEESPEEESSPEDPDIPEEEPESEEEPEEEPESEEEPEEDSEEEEEPEEDSEEEEEPESEDKIKNISQDADPVKSVKNYISMLKLNKDTGVSDKIAIPANVALALNKIKMAGSDQIAPDTEFDFDEIQKKYSVRINKFFDKYGN